MHRTLLYYLYSFALKKRENILLYIVLYVCLPYILYAFRLDHSIYNQQLKKLQNTRNKKNLKLRLRPSRNYCKVLNIQSSIALPPSTTLQHYLPVLILQTNLNTNLTPPPPIRPVHQIAPSTSHVPRCNSQPGPRQGWAGAPRPGPCYWCLSPGSWHRATWSCPCSSASRCRWR